MKNLTNIRPSTDHTAITAALIDNQLHGVLVGIRSALEQCIRAVSHNDQHTAKEFWDRLGDQGPPVLAELAEWRMILQSKAPELVSDIIADADATLTVDADNKVKVPVQPHHQH